MRFFTFNSVKKVELELRITDEIGAEALMTGETKPDDAGALAKAFEHYAKAEERLQARLDTLKETSENPNVEKLLEKLNQQTFKHAVLLNQLVERWSIDPYIEDTDVVGSQTARDNFLQGAVDSMQRKIQEIVIAAGKKDQHMKQKAEGQIVRTETAIHELETALATFAVSEHNGLHEKTGPVRIDPTFARAPTNNVTERQTPKRDFGDRMKAGLETAGEILTNAKALFAEGKFGEAFGQARSAQVRARNGIRILNGVLERKGVDVNTPRIEDKNSTMPLMPSTDKKGGGTVPEVEKRVFPETNNRVVPETNNKIVCDDKQAPSCLRGEMSECHNGTWVCMGSATGGEQILNPMEKPSTTNTLQPMEQGTDGYTFTITGYVHDGTDAPAMANGTPMAGVVMRATGPKTFTTQTQNNGLYTLSFTAAPLGTYDVCVTLPPGYTMNPPSGCETVTVRLSEEYDKTLELENNGHKALHGTGLHFTLLRQ